MFSCSFFSFVIVPFSYFLPSTVILSNSLLAPSFYLISYYASIKNYYPVSLLLLFLLSSCLRTEVERKSLNFLKSISPKQSVSFTGKKKYI